jgi:hypothetical protein
MPAPDGELYHSPAIVASSPSRAVSLLKCRLQAKILRTVFMVACSVPRHVRQILILQWGHLIEPLANDNLPVSTHFAHWVDGQYHLSPAGTANSLTFCLNTCFNSSRTLDLISLAGISCRQHLGGKRFSFCNAVPTSCERHEAQYLCWQARATSVLFDVSSRQLAHSLEARLELIRFRFLQM